VDLLTQEAEGILKPQLSFRVLDLIDVDKSGIALEGGTRFKSPKLAKALTGAESACCFLATVGPGVDMEVKRLMQEKHYADAYVLDALGSMSAENVVEQFYQRMARRQAERDAGVTLRFSPGYCDWPIQQQQLLFKLFQNVEAPEVELSDTCLMTPSKSVSGLFGLMPPGLRGVDTAYNPCNSCKKRDCIARRSDKPN
jgi:hypothetical protein